MVSGVGYIIIIAAGKETNFKWYANNLPIGFKATDININWVFKK